MIDSAAKDSDCGSRFNASSDFPTLSQMRRSSFLQDMLLSVAERADHDAVRERGEFSAASGLFRVMADATTDHATGFMQITCFPETPKAYGALAIFPQSTRQGAEQVALRALAAGARGERGHRSLLTEVRAENGPAPRLHERMDCRLADVMDEHFRASEGTRHNAALMQQLLEVAA